MKTKIGAKRSTQSVDRLDPTAASVLAEIMDPIHEMRLEDAVCNYYGLGRLLEHHPALQRESRAMLQLSESEDIIREFMIAMDRLQYAPPTQPK